VPSPRFRGPLTAGPSQIFLLGNKPGDLAENVFKLGFLIKFSKNCREQDLEHGTIQNIEIKQLKKFS
jgi:hypothetical protein